jgi:hypothetical protein
MTQVIGVLAQGPRYFSKFFNTLHNIKKTHLCFYGFIVVCLCDLGMCIVIVVLFPFVWCYVLRCGFGSNCRIDAASIFPSLINLFELFLGVNRHSFLYVDYGLYGTS